MRKVLIFEKDRIQGDAVLRIQATEAGPTAGEGVRVWLDDEHFREGKIAKVYFSDGLFYDVGELGQVQTVKDLQVGLTEIKGVGELPQHGKVRPQLSGVRTKEGALEWGRKQAERLLSDGAVYWLKRAERVYFVPEA